MQFSPLAHSEFRVFPARIWVLLGVSIVFSILMSWHFFPSVLDDPFIVFRYSERFLQGKGLTWNDGEHVEGYSDLLWVLLVAAGGIFQRNLTLVGWTLGMLANVATLLAVVWAFAKDHASPILPVGSALLLLATSSAFAFWGAASLETSVVDALLAWALAAIHRTPPDRWWLGPGVILGFLAITRPDTILFAVGIAAGLILHDRFRRVAIWQASQLLAVPAAFFISQMI